jgi:hypothetical protein
MSKSKITPEIAATLLEYRAQNLSIDKIAELSGIPRTTLHRFFVKNGVGDIKTKITPEIEQEILQLNLAGVKTKKIAEQFGIAAATVRKVYQDCGVVKQAGAYYLPTNVITPENERLILDLRDQGKGTRQIAKIVGVNRSTIQRFYRSIGLKNQHPPPQAGLLLERVCKMCNVLKDIEQFRKRLKDGRFFYECYCFDCYRIYHNDRGKKQARLLRQTCPWFVIRHSVSYAIWYALKNVGSSKNGESCLLYLAYTIEELVAYLESLFEPWMSWDNYGVYNPKTWDDNDPTTWTWQLDHIIPQSDLPYTSMTDDNFKKCWALENLRPYSSKQNNLDGVKRARHKSA